MWAVLMLAVPAGALSAQGGGAPPAGQRGMQGNRAQLEQRVRQRLGQVVQRQLGLDEKQMAKLQETNRKFAQQRRILVDQERDVRMSLRDEMLRPDSARQPQVAALLDRMLKVQRQRVDLLEQEQKELSTFLTPLQRAKYYGVQEQVRRRTQQMRQQGQLMRQQGRGQGMGQMRPGGRGMMGPGGRGMMGPGVPGMPPGAPPDGALNPAP